MKRLSTSICFLLLLGFLQVFFLSQSQGLYEAKRSTATADTIPPYALVKGASLDFEGLISDYLFLQSLVFIGKSFEQVADQTDSGWSLKKGYGPQQWDWFVAQMNLITDLDPYFYDPYFLGNSSLVWEAQRYADANRLLAKGVAARSWDWTLPFYAGFNAFYFLNDKKSGADYLMEASTRPGSPALLATLAARLAYEENDTGNAIIFLRSFLRDSEADGQDTTALRMRLAALEAIYELEQAVGAFQTNFGRLPSTIDELLEKGVLGEVPDDPYRGTFYLDDTGSVKTTSELGKKKL